MVISIGADSNEMHRFDLVHVADLLSTNCCATFCMRITHSLDFLLHLQAHKMVNGDGHGPSVCQLLDLYFS